MDWTHREVKEAWLLIWEWAGDHAKVQNKIAGIVNGRASESVVARIVEQLWANDNLDWFEKVSYAKSRKNGAYRAERRKLLEGGLTCGHNPRLLAYRAYDLKAYIDNDGREHLIWNYWKLTMKDKDGEPDSSYVPHHLIREVDGTEHYVE